MEGERKLQIILISVATAIFALSYIIGYMVGKEAGFEEAKAKFEVEKQRLLKTLAEISPVSRPVEDKIVSEKKENEPEPVEETEAEENGIEDESNSKVEEPEESSEQQKDDSSVLAPLFQQTQSEPEVQPKPQATKEEEEEKEEEGKFYLQVGVFKNKTNAYKLAEKLKELGYEAQTIALDDSKYTKVIVGYFHSKQEALKVKEELKKDGYNSLLKWR